MSVLLTTYSDTNEAVSEPGNFYFFQERMDSATTEIPIGQYPFSTLAIYAHERNLPPLSFTQKESELGSPLFWVFIGVVLLWGFFYQTNYKTLQNIVLSFRSNVIFSQILEERRTYNSIVSIGLFLTGLLVLATFIYHFVGQIPGVKSDFSTFSPGYVGIIVALLIAYHFFKAIVLSLSSFIFKERDIFNAYNMLSINSMQVLGIILFPIVVLLTYSYQVSSIWLSIIGISIIGLFFLYRLLRSFILGVKETKGQVFHIILYICAFEILPLFVIGKLLLMKY